MIDVACLIHGDFYDFQYVEKLRSMITRNLSEPMQFHVFTESHRVVPDGMIKHVIDPWPNVQGRKSAWWYKMQLFDPKHQLGQVLYLDLDVVITSGLDWILELDNKYFWSIRDFRYLWRSNCDTMNSSLMYFDSSKYRNIWKHFSGQDLGSLRQRFPGDQDYLSSVIDRSKLRWIEPAIVQSWRWQVFDGGMDPKTRRSRSPGQGSKITKDVCVVVFHGTPKPHQIQDPLIDHYWRI